MLDGADAAHGSIFGIAPGIDQRSLLALRTGRGVWHAEAIVEYEIEEGLADTEFRSVLFWVNLARKDKNDEPSAQVEDTCRSRNALDAPRRRHPHT